MSGTSEPSVLTSREQFSVAPPVYQSPLQTTVFSQPLLDREISMNYTAEGTTATVYRPVDPSPTPYKSISSGTTVTNPEISLGDQKRKRGRPRKYGTDSGMGVAMASAQQPISLAVPQSQTFSPPVARPTQPLGGSASPTAKKARGRPPGSSNKKQRIEVIGSTGIGFIPHVISVMAGEDVSAKIMAFSQNGPRAICILSCTGSISNVTLRQAATSGGTATYEGRFDILALHGSFVLSEVGGQKSRTGGLSIILSGPDGRVLGGSVAGLLIATSPVQVIVGSFVSDGRKEVKSSPHYTEPSSYVPQKFNLPAGASSSPSRGTQSESSGGPASPLNLSSGAAGNNNNFHGLSGMSWK